MNQRYWPPKFFLSFFRWFCHPKLREHIEGDLLETYNKQIVAQGIRRADFKFIVDVLLLFRPGIIRPVEGYKNLNTYGMYKSYIKIAWRNLLRQRAYSFIKIGGFAIGIAACLLIALFIQQELSYDLYYRNQYRIYRVVVEASVNGNWGRGLHFPAPFAQAVREEFPEIELAGHYNPGSNFGAGENEVRRADRAESTHEDNFVYMDQGLVDVLELPFILGSSTKALTEPNTIVITESKAKKFFPHEDAIGKLLVLNNDDDRTYKITGVIKDFPITSHIQFNFIMTMAGKEMWPGEATNWSAGNYINYVLVRPQTDIAALEKKFSLIVKNYMLPDAMKYESNKIAIDWLNSMSFRLQPVHEIYLNKIGLHDGLRHGDLRYIWLFGAIACFILLIACINFINLSTARSANRAKEVGLRKVVGSTKAGLVKQFLTESTMFSFFSFILGIALANLSLPYFNQLLARTLTFSWSAWWLLPVLICGAAVIGLIAGLYPSFYLSSFSPVKVLKGRNGIGLRSESLRSALVSFQFVISIGLIICTIVVGRQMKFVLNKNLGFDKEQVLLLHATHTLGKNIGAFKNELINLPGVKSVSVTGFVPVDGNNRDGGPILKEGMDANSGVQSQHWRVDHDYVKTLGLKIVEGRDFNPTIASDSQAVVVNQAMVKELNLKNPVGQRISSIRGEHTIIGVVENFHLENLRQSIQPIELIMDKSTQSVMVKLGTPDTRAAVESITKAWKKFSPNQAIRFTFLDQSIARMYDDVIRMDKIFTAFAALAIIVACLGLFALSAFMVEQRNKEISIRLVLGATFESIFRLLTLNFIKLVLISIVIASPIAWYLMNQWLLDFEYKAKITWDVFAPAGLVSILIALFTISHQSIKAALTQPASNLKSE